MADKNFFDNMINRMDTVRDKMLEDKRNKIHNALAKAFQEEEGVRIEKTSKGRKKKGSKVTKESNTRGNRFPTDEPIDLKPYFRKSKNAKKKATGGWYLVVPIRRFSTSSKKASKSQRMSRKLYDDVRAKAGGETDVTVVSDYLYDRNQKSSIPELNYKPKSKNISVKPNPTGRGNIYTAFRVVSDESPVNSWIINRGSAKQEDLSKRIKRIIKTVRRRS